MERLCITLLCAAAAAAGPPLSDRGDSALVPYMRAAPHVHAPEHTDNVVFRAEMIYDFGGAQGVHALRGLTVQVHHNAVAGYAVHALVGIPREEMMLEVRFDSERLVLFGGARDVAPPSLKRGSDILWFANQPLRVPVTVDADGTSREWQQRQCRACAGVLGLAPGSFWWSLAPHTAFSPGMLIANGAHPSEYGMRRVHLQCRDELVALSARALCVAHDARATVELRGESFPVQHVAIAPHEACVWLPPAAYRAYKRERNLFDDTLARWDDITLRVPAADWTFRIDGAHLFVESDSFHRKIHVRESSANDTAWVGVQALHEYVIARDALAHSATLSTHALGEHLTWLAMLLVAVQTYLLLRWTVQDTTLRFQGEGGTFSVVLTRLQRSHSRGAYATLSALLSADYFYDVVTVLTEFLGLLLVIGTIVFAAVNSIITRALELFIVTVVAVALLFLLELAAVLVAAFYRDAQAERLSQSDPVGATLYRIISTARVNCIRNHAHKSALAIGIWLSLLQMYTEGVDTVFGVAFAFYLTFISVYYAVWSFTLFFHYVRTPRWQEPPDERAEASIAPMVRSYAAGVRLLNRPTPVYLLFLLHTFIATPAFLAYVLWLGIVYVLTPFIKRSLFLYQTIAIFLAAIGLGAAIIAAFMVAKLYGHKQLVDILEQLAEERAEPKPGKKQT